MLTYSFVIMSRFKSPGYLMWHSKEIKKLKNEYAHKWVEGSKEKLWIMAVLPNAATEKYYAIAYDNQKMMGTRTIIMSDDLVRDYVVMPGQPKCECLNCNIKSKRVK